MNTLPEKSRWVKEEFDRLAVDGFLGSPQGKLGMAYLRVSSAGQAEEGRTGFPRQLLHVHEKASQDNIAIPWDLVFFDDHTGFEFRDRPALNQLRDLAKSHSRPADDLVIENLDRLSREASWHQGFLLDELEKDHKVKVHFWKELGSKLERAVYGTVAEDRMRTDLERMATGNRIKAQSGRVTARVPAYGFQLVDSQGTTANAKKDTHYAIYEPEARVMRQIYSWLVDEHASLEEVSRRLTEKQITPPKKSKVWEGTLIYKMISNTVYKGEFYAHRYTSVKRTSKRTGKVATHKIQRPHDQWILVPVPALVSPKVWAVAQKVVKDNRTLSLRNAKHQYLLVSLTECAECKSKLSVGARYITKGTKAGERRYDLTYYRCTSRQRPKHIQDALGLHCKMPQISSRRLDELVWNVVLTVLLDPQRLKEGLDRYFARQGQGSVSEEIAYVQSQLTDLEVEDERLYQAYISKAFDAEEFAHRRQVLRARRTKLETTRDELQQKKSKQTDWPEKMKAILQSAEEFRARAHNGISFERKRRILMMVVDKIVIDTREEWFELEGAISGRFDFIPAGRDSSRRSVGSWREKSACRSRG
jgi:site-specific DNA recombinase